MIAYIAFGCRLLLAVVFFAAAAGKLSRRRNLAEFRASVGVFGVKPRWRSAVAAAVIACELTVAALLTVNATALVGLGGGAALLIVFTAAISSVVQQRTSASCRCFGISAQPLGRRHLVRNAILLSITAVGVAATVLATALEDTIRNPTALMLSGFVAMVLAALVISYDDLVAMLLPPSKPVRGRASG
ncbi:MauE/DoxX family redox-associated membrane protein [Nonomuraea sp. NPDC050663]|uniref:MauE/DoxX family redox-associated membrane protein n=1 Tax=Nonomuraea sp. NPDC050663 TaxID=3364370 RepID=UPI00379DF438